MHLVRVAPCVRQACVLLFSDGSNKCRDRSIKRFTGECAKIGSQKELAVIDRFTIIIGKRALIHPQLDSGEGGTKHLNEKTATTLGP